MGKCDEQAHVSSKVRHSQPEKDGGIGRDIHVYILKEGVPNGEVDVRSDEC